MPRGFLESGLKNRGSVSRWY